MASYSQNPTKDAFVRQSNGNGNYGSTQDLCVGEGSTGIIDSFFIAFDMSSIPTWAVINSAVLRFYQFDGADDWLSPTIGIQAYPVNVAWTEAGVTWNNQPSVWDIPSPVTNFANNIASYVDINVTTLVAWMTDNPSLHDGFRVHYTGSSSSTRKQFRSKDYTNASYRPVLIIDYTDNTAPYWSGGAAASTTLTGIIPENTSSFTINWPAANDNEGNTLYYNLYRIVNGVSTLIVQGTTGRSYVQNNPADLAGYGGTLQYQVYVNDGLLWAANNTIYSNVVTINNFTKATLASVTSIVFESTQIAFTWSGASNTNGNGTFGYTLKTHSGNITVYNGNAAVTTPYNMPIWRTGDAVPSGPYIKFDDLKTFLAAGGYAGSIIIDLYTTNAYSSAGISAKTISVDLRKNPTGLGVPAYSNGYLYSGTTYFLPDLRAINLNWTAATDPLGTAITYDVYYKLTTSGTWTLARSNLATNSTTISPPSGATQLGYNVKVVAKTAYGYTQEQSGATLLIDKYVRPILRVTSKVRAQLSITINVAIDRQSTIANANLIGVYDLYYHKKDGTTHVDIPTVVGDTTKQFVYSSDVDINTSYNVEIVLQDQFGQSFSLTPVSTFTVISAFTPVFSVRRKGFGINAVNDGTGNYKAIIKGKMNSFADADGYKGFYVDDVDVRYGFKNWIMNGGFDVCQRGVSRSLPTDVLAYEADRWFDGVFPGGGTMPTLTRLISDSIIDNKYVKFSRVSFNGAGTIQTSSLHVYAQCIERGVKKLCGSGKKISVSFWARSDVSGKKLGFYPMENYGSGGSPSSQEYIVGNFITLTNTWTRYTATFTTNTLTAKTFGTANDDRLSLEFMIMWGSGYAARCGDTVAETYRGAGYVDISNVCLVQGDVAADYVSEPFESVLSQCQRYCYAVESSEGIWTYYGTGLAISTTQAKFLVPLPVTMRKAPTLTGAATMIVADELAGSWVVNGIVCGNNSSRFSAVVVVTTAGTLPTAKPLVLAANNSLGSYLVLECDF